MRSRTYRVLLVALAASALAGGSAHARADGGGPSPGVSMGWDGVLAPSATLRYVALPAGRDTVVALVRVRGGRVVRFGSIKGSYGVPLVAYDGSAGGLSHDGRTLVLASALVGPASRTVTRLVAFDVRKFRVRKLVTLRGAFSFDALSPDGSTLYLIQYTSDTNYLRYDVRAYDLRAGKLLPGKIADRREPKEKMNGSPVTRATSADGGWVYTLYQNPGGQPFVHALDARHRQAVCVDLPWKGAQDRLFRMRLSLSSDERKLLIGRPGETPALVVDTRTFAVTR